MVESLRVINGLSEILDVKRHVAVPKDRTEPAGMSDITFNGFEIRRVGLIGFHSRLLGGRCIVYLYDGATDNHPLSSIIPGFYIQDASNTLGLTLERKSKDIPESVTHYSIPRKRRTKELIAKLNSLGLTERE